MVTELRSSPIMGLYGRSRGWTTVLVGLALLTLTSWWLAAWLGAFQGFWYPEARVPVTASAPLLAATLLSRALVSPDVDLDRASPVHWPTLRAGHVLAWTAVCVVLLGLTATAAPLTFGSAALVRNALGYVGLTCLAAVVLGARLAWLPGLVVGFTLYLAAPRIPSSFDRWWAWPCRTEAGTDRGSWPAACSWPGWPSTRTMDPSERQTAELTSTPTVMPGTSRSEYARASSIWPRTTVLAMTVLSGFSRSR
ncbi:MAG: hypothetical protein ACR2FV_16420 [Ornithinimicrobium sp.]|uniref:hypothetical protein n=1 Tax=Ornithinimicrobium sp. TaxID=1977084 RepID=UPI003D9AB78F